MIVQIPPTPPMDAYGKQVFAIEVSFTSLLNEAQQLGIPLLPVVGLMYLPDQSVTRQFQEACRAVLASLAVE